MIQFLQIKQGVIVKKKLLILVSLFFGSSLFPMVVNKKSKSKGVQSSSGLHIGAHRSPRAEVNARLRAEEARLMEQADLESAQYNSKLCQEELANLLRHYAEQTVQLELGRAKNSQLRRTLVLVLQQLPTVFSVLSRSTDEQVKAVVNLNTTLRQLLELLIADQPLGTVVVEWHTKLKKLSKLSLDLIETLNTIKKSEKKLSKEIGDLCGKEKDELGKEVSGSLEFENQELKDENQRLKAELESYSSIFVNVEKMMKLLQDTTSKM